MSRWRWLLWLAYVVVWTVALLVPVPPLPDLGISPSELRFVLAKTAHVLAYVLLAVLTGWLHAPSRWRWLLLFAIVVHGTVTELLQLLTSSRTGQLLDVGLDNLGVALGLAVSWKWWAEDHHETHEKHEKRQTPL